MIEIHEQRTRKCTIGTILKTSASRSWSGVWVDQIQYSAGIAPPIELGLTEVIISTRRDNALITRKAGSTIQSSRSDPGVVWLCPAGVHEEEVVIHAPIELLHVYLPPIRFAQLADLCGGTVVKPDSIGYLDNIRDELIRQIGLQILSELTCQTAGGHMLIDALSLSLTARLAQAYASTEGRPPQLRARQGLDEFRLRRVLDYMRSHLDDDIGIGELASVACLSPYHFARMFQVSTGTPPSRYLSTLRLERAKIMLACTDTPICDIALTACFSTQANFSRAFRSAVGMPPGEFRRRSR